jgi:hypothetical protein
MEIIADDGGKNKREEIAPLPLSLNAPGSFRTQA